MRHTIWAIVLCAVAAVPASAQLQLEFKEGRVTIDATSVPPRTILNEWAKLGDTRIIGAERIAGSPLTLKLIDVSEAQALEIILRSVAGYMAAPRGPASKGASMYDRILVMATSTPPPATSSTPTRAGTNAPGQVNMPGTQRFVPQRPPVQSNEDEDEDDEDPNPPAQPVFTFPQPGQQPGAIAPGMSVPPANGGAAAPGSSIVINPTTPTGGVTTPPGARVPGMITQPVAPPIPGQPVPPPIPGQPPYPPGVRPPGQ